MNGVAVLNQMLSADAAVTAIVPGDRIISGNLPLNVELDAITITDVSGVDLSTIAPGDKRFTTDRVQVTVVAKNYERLVAALKAVKSAGDAKHPAIEGLENVVVRTDGQGPYFTDETSSIHMKSQDFKVSYVQPA